MSTGWSLSEASDKFILSAALSMVLAFLLLELCHDLRHDCVLLPPESARLNLGQHEEAQPSKDAQRMKRLLKHVSNHVLLLLLLLFLLFLFLW
jgi:sugar phosphate permease